VRWLLVHPLRIPLWIKLVVAVDVRRRHHLGGWGVEVPQRLGTSSLLV
jgi:hypothetical protein